MFVKKSQAEIAAMTDEQAEVYATQKAQHEAELQSKAIANAIEENEKAIKAAFKAENDALAEKLEAQGKRLAKLSTSQSESKKESLEAIFKEKYDAVVGGDQHTVEQKDGFTIDTSKAIVSTDVMSVTTVSAGDFPAAGSTGVVGAGVNTMMGKLLGYFGYRSATSRILDLVDVQPMNEATLIVINESVIGTAAVTTECKLKPIVKMSFATQEVTADPVAVMWFTTTKLRRFFPALVNRMLLKFGELVNDALPAVVLNAIRTGATAFTPVPQLAINANPNNYDALGAVIATIENLNYNVTGIILNPIAWRNMKQEKTAEGVYTLSNGQSISILQNGLDWGGVQIPIIKDPALGVDEFIVGDIFGTVKVGVDSQLMYFETDGRVDAQATTATTGLARNIRTHVLEKFFAVIIPTATQTGLVKDTFANVKTLITAA